MTNLKAHMTNSGSHADFLGLERFLHAQTDSVYSNVLQELKSGKKKTHWIWFIFPQLIGLGQSDFSKYYGIKSLKEAQAYWEHPVLGSRLRECIAIVNGLNFSAVEILGNVDAGKFKSCLTLFSQVKGLSNAEILKVALEHFYAGQLDLNTLELLSRK